MDEQQVPDRSSAYLSYDPTLSCVQANPFPYYSSLREHDPIHWNERLQVWVISRYLDVMGMLRDPRWSSNYVNSTSGDELKEKGSSRPAWNVLLFMDSPEHTVLRRVVASCMDKRIISHVSASAKAATTQFLDSFRGRREVELISEFAAPLSIAVLGRLLGIPDSDLPILAESAQLLSTFVDWSPSDSAINGLQERGAAFFPYLFHLIKQKRIDAGDDLISALVSQAKIGKIRYADVASTAILMIAAGHVTTTHMIGNGVLALLQDHCALRDYKSGLYSTPQVVDELLRFDGPVQATPRTALSEFTIRGSRIRKGDMALGLLGSANRDDAAFVEPDRINLGRLAGYGASFGTGAHYCIGASIARMIGAIALDGLFGSFPQLRLSEQKLAWKRTITQRGLMAMLICL